MNQHVLFVCPFCRETITETESLIYDSDAVEVACEHHIRQRHPVRRYLSPRFRRVFKQRRTYSAVSRV